MSGRRGGPPAQAARGFGRVTTSPGWWWTDTVTEATLGVVFRPQSPPERLRDVVAAAEEAGVAELWLWEDCFLEGGLTAAAAALATPPPSATCCTVAPSTWTAGSCAWTA